MKGILEFLQERKDDNNENNYMTTFLNRSDSPYNVVNFVTGSIRGYIDLKHTESVLLDRSVALLRTKQQGYVPLEYFPPKVRALSDETKIIKICSRILELERTAMRKLINSESVISNDIGRVFTPGDIIIGDSKHTSDGIYVPFVDENSVVVKENIVDPKVKKLIKDYYIDKI